MLIETTASEQKGYSWFHFCNKEIMTSSYYIGGKSGSAVGNENSPY